MNRPRKILAVFIAVAAVILLLLFFVWLHYLNTPLISSNQSAVKFVLVKNSSVRSVSKALVEKKIISKPIWFVLLAYMQGDTRNLQAGSYLLEPGITPYRLLNKFVTGDVVLHSFTIIPGQTFKQMMQTLEQDPQLKHTLRGLNNTQIMQKIGHPGEYPEGRFFPDTYKYAAATDDVDVLRAAYQLMQYHLTEAWNTRSANLPYSCPHQALIAASIIEKEAGLEKERPIIADIIVRRLRRNMYLQLDPTLIYGLEDKYRGKITAKDLKMDNQYNTYRYKGLPPTPICMPSGDAIFATLHPKATKYLYFVAKGDNSHEFSVTLKQHNIAVRKYQLKVGRKHGK